MLKKPQQQVDGRCRVSVHGNSLFVSIEAELPEDELSRLARGVARVLEPEYSGSTPRLREVFHVAEF